MLKDKYIKIFTAVIFVNRKKLETSMYTLIIGS